MAEMDVRLFLFAALPFVPATPTASFLLIEAGHVTDDTARLQRCDELAMSGVAVRKPGSVS